MFHGALQRWSETLPNSYFPDHSVTIPGFVAFQTERMLFWWEEKWCNPASCWNASTWLTEESRLWCCCLNPVWIDTVWILLPAEVIRMTVAVVNGCEYLVDPEYSVHYLPDMHMNSFSNNCFNSAESPHTSISAFMFKLKLLIFSYLDFWFIEHFIVLYFMINWALWLVEIFTFMNYFIPYLLFFLYAVHVF